MCGLAGFIDAKLQRGFEPSLVLERMTSAIRHRGPDSMGAWLDPTHGVALGHRRLAIIDVSASGHQPMFSRSGRYVLVFNGEIYNFKTLRSELERAGVVFRGLSDTEVLVEAVERWGLLKALTVFEGMFAFALWDREKNTLTLARDRMGEKPLYYGWQGEHFLFASELKSLKPHPAWKGELEEGALLSYFRYNYIPAPLSIYKNINKLEPGHYYSIEFSSAGVREIKEKYWGISELAASVSSSCTLSEREIIEKAELILKKAVGLEMVSDVPLGAFLSGGIDSSTIVALMQEQSSQPVHTFTIGYEEKEYNEIPFAREIANHLGTKHHEFLITAQESLTIVPSLSAIYDEPFADSSQIPTSILAKRTKEFVTVALSGDGGDEVFTGYNRYLFVPELLKKLQKIPKPLRWGARVSMELLPAGTVAALGAGVGHGRWSLAEDKFQKLIKVLDANDGLDFYKKIISSNNQPAELFSNDLPDLFKFPDSSWLGLQGVANQEQLVDQLMYLPDDILVKTDRASMASSLELRAPFLYHPLVEFLWTVPLEIRLKNKQSKWLLRKILSKYIPEKMFLRPKAGFAVPIGSWLRSDLRVWAEELLVNLHPIFSKKAIQKYWQEHQSGKRNHEHVLWSILMFQAWLENEKRS